MESEGLQLYRKETPTQVFSCEIYQIFKNPYFEEHLKRLLPTLSVIPQKNRSLTTICVQVILKLVFNTTS